MADVLVNLIYAILMMTVEIKAMSPRRMVLFVVCFIQSNLLGFVKLYEKKCENSLRVALKKGKRIFF